MSDLKDVGRLDARSGTALTFGAGGATAAQLKTDGKLAVAGTTASYTVDVNGTGALKLPSGTTAQRPAHAAGLMRWNSTDSNVEVSDGSTWWPRHRWPDTTSSALFPKRSAVSSIPAANSFDITGYSAYRFVQFLLFGFAVAADDTLAIQLMVGGTPVSSGYSQQCQAEADGGAGWAKNRTNVSNDSEIQLYANVGGGNDSVVTTSTNQLHYARILLINSAVIEAGTEPFVGYNCTVWHPTNSEGLLLYGNARCLGTTSAVDGIRVFTTGGQNFTTGKYVVIYGDFPI